MNCKVFFAFRTNCPILLFREHRRVVIRHGDIAVAAVDGDLVALAVGDNDIVGKGLFVPLDLAHGTVGKVIAGAALPVDIHQRAALVKADVGLQDKHVGIVQLFVSAAVHVRLAGMRLVVRLFRLVIGEGAVIGVGEIDAYTLARRFAHGLRLAEVEDIVVLILAVIGASICIIAIF